MPKIVIPKYGHLIKGEVEYTLVRSEDTLKARYEYKEGTFADLTQAANEARKKWLASCDAGTHMTTYVLYMHTKGKKTYSRGHFKQIPWQDHDSTNPKVLN